MNEGAVSVFTEQCQEMKSNEVHHRLQAYLNNL